jgi:hypothetical protein
MFIVKYEERTELGNGFGIINCADTLDSLGKAIDICEKKGRDIIAIDVIGKEAEEIMTSMWGRFKNFRQYKLSYVNK